MSVPLIIALNIGAAALLALLVTTLMALPKRLRPHRHAHLQVPDDAPATPATPHRPAPTNRGRQPARAAGGQPVIDS